MWSQFAVILQSSSLSLTHKVVVITGSLSRTKPSVSEKKAQLANDNFPQDYWWNGQPDCKIAFNFAVCSTDAGNCGQQFSQLGDSLQSFRMFSFNEPVRRGEEGSFVGKWDALLCLALASCFSEPLLRTFSKEKKIGITLEQALSSVLLHSFFKLSSPLCPSHPRPRCLSSPFWFGSSPLLLKFLARPSRPLFPSDSELVRQERLAS